MLASFQTAGKTTSERDFLNMNVSMGASSFAHSLSILLGTLSGPEALPGFKFYNNFSTPVTSMFNSGMLRKGSPSNSGGALVFSRSGSQPAGCYSTQRDHVEDAGPNTIRLIKSSTNLYFYFGFLIWLLQNLVWRVTIINHSKNNIGRVHCWDVSCCMG